MFWSNRVLTHKEMKNKTHIIGSKTNTYIPRFTKNLKYNPPPLQPLHVYTYSNFNSATDNNINIRI